VNSNLINPDTIFKIIHISMVSFLWLKDNGGYFVGNAIEKGATGKFLFN